MDEADRAQSESDAFLRHCLAQAGGKGKTSMGCIECEDCGEEIPEGRRLAVPGCTLCVTCKTKREKGCR